MNTKGKKKAWSLAEILERILIRIPVQTPTAFPDNLKWKLWTASTLSFSVIAWRGLKAAALQQQHIPLATHPLNSACSSRQRQRSQAELLVLHWVLKGEKWGWGKVHNSEC